MRFLARLLILAALCAPSSAQSTVDDMRALQDRFRNQRSEPAVAAVGTAQPSSDFESMKRRYREAVDCARPYLLDSLRGGPEGPDASLSDMVCDDAAPKLVIMLQDKGLKAELVQSKGPHIFIRVPHPDGPLYIDPTIRQFFGLRQAPKTVPEIFVGSLAELRRLFADPLTPPLYRGGADKSWADLDKNYLTVAENKEIHHVDPLEKMNLNPKSAESSPLFAFREDRSCRVGP